MTSSRPSTLASDSTAAARQAESGRTEALEPQLLFEQINRTVVFFFYFFLFYYYFIISFYCR